MKHKITGGNIEIIKNLRPEVFVKTTYNNLKTAWRASARAFFKEVAAHIAIDTGMSRASLLPLAGVVRGAKAVQTQLEASSGSSKGWYDISGEYHPEGFRSRARGESEARSRLDTQQYIRFGTQAIPHFEFRFEIVIYQWAIHENRWRALEAGQNEFLRVLDLELRDRLRPADLVRFMRTGKTTDRSK